MRVCAAGILSCMLHAQVLPSLKKNDYLICVDVSNKMVQWPFLKFYGRLEVVESELVLDVFTVHYLILFTEVA